MTSSSANITITGTGSGTANPGDYGTATLYQNGTAIFNISGVFTGFVNFFQGRGIPVTLAEGNNHFFVTGSVEGCSASDSMTIYYAPPEDKELGIGDKRDNCLQNMVGNPINLFNGNNVEAQTDLSFNSPFAGGLSFERHYNSQSVIDGAMGYGWSHSFSFSLYKNIGGNANRIKVMDNTGRGYYFQDYDVDTVFEGEFSENSSVTIDTQGNYIWEHKNYSYLFDSSTGFLSSIICPMGNTMALSYDSSGLLQTVIDQASGRKLTFNYNSDNRISYITGPVTAAVVDGIWATYEYDTSGNLIKAVYSDDSNGSSASGYQYRYEDSNDPNNMTVKYDLSGRFISSWAYDGQDRAIENVNRDGNNITINFDDPGNVVVTDAYGLSNTYEISRVAGQEKITKKIGASNCNTCSTGIVRAQFDQKTGLPTEREWANGRIDQFQDYDTNGNPGTWIISSGTDEAKTVFTTWHPVLFTPLSRTQKSLLADVGTPDRTRVMIWDYDDPNTVGDTEVPNETPTHSIHRIIEKGFTLNLSGSVIPYEIVTTMGYNEKGQITYIDGPLPGTGDRVDNTYDPVTGDLLTMTHPITGTTTLEYDAAGNVIRVVDVNAVETLITYDGKNRQTSATVDGKTSSQTFSAAGLIQSVTDRAGLTINITYNTSGLLEKITDPAGNYLQFVYDANSNLIDSSAYTDQGIRTRYNGYSYGNPASNPDLVSGKPWKSIVRNQDNTADLETVYTYSYGNISTITDPASVQTSFFYNTQNRLILKTEQLSDTQTASTGYDYDLHGNLVQVTDANNNVTQYTYDDAGRLVKQVSPDTGTTRYVYDEAGNLKTKIYNDTRRTAYTYDALNRLTAILYDDSAQDVIYFYDQNANGVGRLTGISDATGIYRFTYNTQGQLITKTQTTDTTNFTTSYTYDDGGKVTSVMYPDHRVVDYSYDTSGRISLVSTTKDGQTRVLAQSVAYLPFGPVRSLEYGNSKLLTSEFDLQYRPLNRTIPGLNDLVYGYDLQGNIISITDALDATRNKTFGYDKNRRLIDSTGLYGTISYTYDPVGNRLTRTANGFTETNTYINGTNKLSEITGSSPPISFGYDANGNIITKGNRFYDYNQNNRLISVTENTTPLAEYRYNSFNQRVGKITDGQSTLFHYDLAGNLISETLSDGTVLKEYIYLGNTPIAMIDNTPGPAVYYIDNDHLGSPNHLTDQAGQTVWKADYHPFGEVNTPVNTVGNNLRFPGQYFDAETGMHYNWHRYYDPDTGRYFTPDPIGLAGGINPFVYALNNPINYTDPLGLLVNMVYNVNTGQLTATDSETGQEINMTAISGGKPYGDHIPYGGYEILDQAQNPDFFRLDALDKKPRNDIHEPTGRNHFRLHKPGRTVGCVAAEDQDDWDKLKNMLNNTTTTTVNDNFRPWWKFWEKPQTIKKYGNLTVVK